MPLLEFQATTKIEINSESITSFQENVVKYFTTDLKGNISKKFSSQDIVASFVSLILRSCHKMTLLICRHMGKNSLVFLRAAESIEGEEYIMPALVLPDIHTEWMTFKRYTSQQSKEGTMKLLKELATNSMLVETILHLSDLAKVSLSIPAGTASVEQSFSQMKMIKTRLRNNLGEQNLAHLMRIAIETPEKLPDDIAESVVDI